MVHKPSLVALALGLIAAASSLESPRNSLRSSAGLRIPLHKRHGLKAKKTVFDFDMATREVEVLKSKHRRNLENIKTNGGNSIFTNSASIKPTAALPMGKRDATGSVPLTNNDDVYWTGSINIGDPAQSFTVDFDTGSADLWIPGISCWTCGAMHSMYDPSKSSQSQKQPGVFEISYGDKSSTSGTPYTDTVSIAGVSVVNQSFAVVTQESFEFQHQSFDGIMGMGLTALSTLGEDPFFQTAVNQNAVTNGTFAFKLGQEGSELFLGGTNQDLYTGDIEYHDLYSDVGFWVIGPADVEVNGEPGTQLPEILTIIDSGTTLIVAPPDAAAAFYALIEGSQQLDQGFFSFPCDSTPAVAFNWGGKSWNISANNFNLGPVAQGSSQCVGAIMGEDLGFTADKPVWLLGDSYMKNVYTVFSVDTNSVGFAELK